MGGLLGMSIMVLVCEKFLLCMKDNVCCVLWVCCEIPIFVNKAIKR